MAVTNDLTLIHECEAITDATTGHVLSNSLAGVLKSYAADEVTPRQGTYCYGADLDIETGYFQIAHGSSSWNFTNCAIFGWFNFITANYLDTWQNGGVLCRLSDGTNYSEWYLGGSDNFVSGWQRLVFSTSSTPDAVSGTLSISAVTTIQYYFTGVIKSKLAENVLMDFLHYGSDGVGMTITGGSSGTPETLDDIVGDDDTAAIGLIKEVDGVYFLNGSIIFGDSGGTSDMYFKDTNKVISTIGRYRSFTTTNRTSAESLLSSSHYSITIEGNSTGTISFVFGDATGTSGYNGCVILNGGDIAPIFTIGNANVDTLNLYGSSFIGLANITFVNDGTHLIYSCTFSGCDQVIPTGAPIIRNCIFVNTTDVDAALLWNENINIQSCNFIANTNGAAIEMPSAVGTPYAYNALFFSGNTYDVLNSSGSAITINKNSNSDPSTYEGSSVTFSATFSFTITGLEYNTEVTIVTAGTSTELFHVENATTSDGDGKYQVTYTHSGGASVDVLIHHVDYQPDVNNIYSLTLPNSNSSAKVSMFDDLNYANP